VPLALNHSREHLRVDWGSVEVEVSSNAAHVWPWSGEGFDNQRSEIRVENEIGVILNWGAILFPLSCNDEVRS
jgi:hypothetical protein